MKGEIAMNSKKNFLGMLLICDKLIANGNIKRDPKNPDNILVWKTNIEPEGFYSVNVHTAMAECYNDEKQFEDFITAAEKVGVDTGKLFLEAYFRLHLTKDSFHSWDDLYKAADGKGYRSPELIAKDNARGAIKDFLLDNEGINIDDMEIPEDAIDDYDAVYHFLFDDEGHMVSYEKKISNPYDASKLIQNMTAREIFTGMKETEKEALYLMFLEENKVIEELEGAMWLTTNDDGETNNLSIQVVSFEDAVEIVKQGGVSDDVCVWKRDVYGRWHTECHIVVYNNPLEYTYCPYCGKKIKVVE